MATKTSVKKCVSAASNLITRIPSCSIPQKLANFSRLNSKGLYQISEKEKEGRCLDYSASTKINVVVMQQQQRNVQSCCFANLNLLLFCRLHSRCHRHRLSIESHFSLSNYLLKSYTVSKEVFFFIILLLSFSLQLYEGLKQEKCGVKLDYR